MAQSGCARFTGKDPGCGTGVCGAAEIYRALLCNAAARSSSDPAFEAEVRRQLRPVVECCLRSGEFSKHQAIACHAALEQLARGGSAAAADALAQTAAVASVARPGW